MIQRIKESGIYHVCYAPQVTTIPTINLVDNFYHYNEEPGISIYSYEIGSASDLKNEHTNLTFIEFSDAQKRQLLRKFHIDENEKLYVYISDTPSDDERTATSEYDYIFMLENGTRLNLNDLNEDFTVTVSVPIRDLDLANFKYAKQFSDNGYDIYDKNSDFYIDPCTSAYLHKDDIPLKDRKKDIYPNVTLCKGSNCHYKEANLNDHRIVCECNLNAEKINETAEEDDFMEDDSNVKNYILDNINYKIIKCYYLLLNFNNLKRNPAFYVIIIIFGIVVFCCVKFAFFGIQKIRIAMYAELPTEQKVKEQVREELRKMRNNSIVTKVNDSPPKKKEKEKNKKKNKKDKNDKKDKQRKKDESETDSEFYQTDNFKKRKRIDIKKNIKKGNYIDPKVIATTKTDLLSGKNLQKEDLEKVIEKKEEDYNKSPYTQALREDKRKCCSVFFSLLFDKVDFLNLCKKNEFFKTIMICQFFTSLMLNFFFNSFFYSDDIVSRKYHNNGNLDYLVTLALSIVSTIFTAIIMNFLERTMIFEEWLNQIHEIKKEYKYLYALNKFLKYLKIQVGIFFTIEILIILWGYYYIVIFFIIYSKSRKSLFINFINSICEELIKSLIVIAAIVLTRRIGFICKNSYIYNTSKFIDDNF